MMNSTQEVFNVPYGPYGKQYCLATVLRRLIDALPEAEYAQLHGKAPLPSGKTNRGDVVDPNALAASAELFDLPHLDRIGGVSLGARIEIGDHHLLVKPFPHTVENIRPHLSKGKPIGRWMTLASHHAGGPFGVVTEAELAEHHRLAAESARNADR